MSDGLVSAGEGTDALTVDREALIARWAENFGLDLCHPFEVVLAQQEAEHVAGLVDAAWRAGYGQGRVDEASGGSGEEQR